LVLDVRRFFSEERGRVWSDKEREFRKEFDSKFEKIVFPHFTSGTWKGVQYDRIIFRGIHSHFYKTTPERLPEVEEACKKYGVPISYRLSMEDVGIFLD